MMLSILLFSLYNLVDAFWVGKLSPDAIAAVSISQISLFAMISLSMGIAVGSSVLMGMNIGAGNLARVREAFKTAAYLGSGSAALVDLLAFLFAHNIVGAFTHDPVVVAYAVQYFHIVPLGYVFFSLAFIESNVFQGLGRSWLDWGFAHFPFPFLLLMLEVRPDSGIRDGPSILHKTSGSRIKPRVRAQTKGFEEALPALRGIVLDPAR